MLLLGSIGVFVSTVFKKTMVAVIVTYGFAVFIYGFTGLAAIFLAQTFFRGSSYVPGLLLGLNPMGALISVFNPDFSHDVFNRQTNLQLWHIFIPVYSVVTAVALWFSIAFLRPRMKRG
jgi:hypothetical protein